MLYCMRRVCVCKPTCVFEQIFLQWHSSELIKKEKKMFE